MVTACRGGSVLPLRYRSQEDLLYEVRSASAARLTPLRVFNVRSSVTSCRTSDARSSGSGFQSVTEIPPPPVAPPVSPPYRRGIDHQHRQFRQIPWPVAADTANTVGCVERSRRVPRCVYWPSQGCARGPLCR